MDHPQTRRTFVMLHHHNKPLQVTSLTPQVHSHCDALSQLTGSTHMTWKERKELENKKVVSLGGKPSKQQRLPLSVARVVMKKQKERDQKMLEERMILGRFGAKFTSSDTKKTPDRRRRPEEKVLKSTEGRFRNGVLDVKHMLQSGARKEPRERATPSFAFNEERKKKGPKKSKGKRKGGGKKRH